MFEMCIKYADTEYMWSMYICQKYVQSMYCSKYVWNVYKVWRHEPGLFARFFEPLGQTSVTIRNKESHFDKT